MVFPEVCAEGSPFTPSMVRAWAWTIIICIGTQTRTIFNVVVDLNIMTGHLLARLELSITVLALSHTICVDVFDVAPERFLTRKSLSARLTGEIAGSRDGGLTRFLVASEVRRRWRSISTCSVVTREHEERGFCPAISRVLNESLKSI